MSRNAVRPAAHQLDARIRRTRDRLGEALVKLIQEQPFDTITVQSVLGRARVGRSTFYVHFRDKDDLFLSEVDEFFEGMATLLARRGDTSTRVAPVRELFAHVAEVQEFYRALVRSGKIHDVLELGQAHFARGIEVRLADRPGTRGDAASERKATANLLAGALLSLLSWWVAHDRPATPERMDELFHRLVESGVGAGAADSAAR